MARKVVEYRVVDDYIQSRFQKTVMEHLARGWELQGGVSVGCKDNGSIHAYAQAVVKYEEKQS